MALHLLRAACFLRDKKLEEENNLKEPSLSRIMVVDFVKPNEFQEIEEFRKEILAKYLVYNQILGTR